MAIQRHNPAYRLAQNFKTRKARLSRAFFLFRVFFLAVSAAVNFFVFIGEIEYMGKSLLDGGDAAGILAVNHVGDLFGKA